MKGRTDTVLAVWLWITLTASGGHAELTSQFVSHSLLLTCTTSGLPPGTDVISIVISNTTTTSHQHSGSSRDDTLAWMTSDGVPKLGNGSGGGGRGGGRWVFVSGRHDVSKAQGWRLEVLFLHYNASRPALFTCTVRVHGHQAHIETRDYRLQVDGLPNREEEEEKEEEEAVVPQSASEKGSESGTKKLTTRGPDRDEDPALRTGSVLQPTVVETGTPMSVVIAMLVLITLLFVITSILLLQKFKERCGSQPVPYPAHYALAREGGVEAWGGDPMLGGMLKGSPSMHTMVGLRSHYSLPRPLQPPPPPPKLLRSKSRESGDYAGGQCGVPPGMTRSFHYTTPYDAIVHDEDGELSLLNTSSHCDVTPALPPEQAAEPTYKVPRVEAEAQTQGQGHSMYVCGVPNGGPTFELE